jgi:hypothetical protein
MRRYREESTTTLVSSEHMHTHAHQKLRTGVAAICLALPLLLAPVTAEAKPKPRSCNSSDLRYSFMPGQPKFFGVFNLTITGGTCATAHHVAKDWQKQFEANVKAGHDKKPRLMDGYAFKTLDAHEAQAFIEQGTKGRTTIRFKYRVPNG